MAQADSQSTTDRAVLRSPETHLAAKTVTLSTTVPVRAGDPEASDPIFAAMEAHKRELDTRNRTIEAICAAEDRHKLEEGNSCDRYEAASIALLTTKPSTIAGLIAVLNYVALPEGSGPGISETILDGARLSSNREAAAAAERFPALSAEALEEIAGEQVPG